MTKTGSLTISTVVNESGMYLRVEIEDRAIMIPYDEAGHLCTRINKLVPYQYGEMVRIPYEFTGLLDSHTAG